MSLLAGDLLSAEGILLQNGLIDEAIKMNLEVYNWNRALELAIRHKRLLEDVLNARTEYLKLIDKEETNQSFLAYISTVAKSRADQVNDKPTPRPQEDEESREVEAERKQTPTDA